MAPGNLVPQLAGRYAAGLTHVAKPALAVLAAALVVGLSSWPLPVRRHAPVRWALLLVVGAVAVAWSYSLLWMGDDAFISFRYARNLATGRGLVYNPGERVEGYTDFLWTLLLAAGTYCKVSPLLTATVLSLGSLLGTILLSTRLVGLLAPRPGPVLLSAAAVAIAGNYVMASFGTSGLETMFAACLVLVMLERILGERPLVAGVAGIAAALSHPDHLLFYFCVGAALLLSRETRKLTPRFAVPLVALYVPYFVWRYRYYGDPYPNTYYAKSANLSYFSQGTTYALVTLAAAGLFVALPLSIAGAAARWRTLAGRFFLMALPGYCTYVCKVGGDFMLGRFFVVLIPLVLVFAECFIRDLFARRTPKARVGGAAALAGTLVAALPVEIIRPGEKPWHIADEGSFYRMSAPSDAGVKSFYFKRAGLLNRLKKDTARTPYVASGNLGILGYYADIPLVDVFGLTDRDVARMPIRTRSRPGHEKLARGPYYLLREVDLADDPVYPDPYSKLTELRVDDAVFYSTAYDPRLMRRLEGRRGYVVPSVRAYVDSYDPTQSKPSAAQLACDLWFLNQYYFRVNPDPRRRERLTAAATRYDGSWQGLEALILPTEAPAGFSPKPLFHMAASEPWVRTGTAFGAWPTRGLVPDQGFVFGQDGEFANSADDPGFDRGTGELLSPEFIVEGDAITLRVGGGRDAGAVYVALEVEGTEAVRATGCEAEILGQRLWDVRPFRGKRARIRVVDRAKGGWGHILVDEIVQWSSSPPAG